ncbi:MAG TPA: adenosylcobalamin-dependent ribonucleoside-diphosphate reductase [Candidatus Dormibacteraeota bacterium]|nr:adenosylcobalamin-dependent ribonucleoside-diphosphate reductase [Candidatus Dormibacteraeota bacterium]
MNQSLSRAEPGPTAPPAVRDRAGELVPFDRGRITAAVLAAMREVRRADPARAEEVADLVLSALPAQTTPTVEQIQDQVERALMQLGLEDVARAYITYRRRRAELREAKRLLGVRDELKLPLNSVVVLRDRYLLRDQRRQVVESTGEMMDRVARHVAQAEDAFVAGSSARWAEEFSRALRGLEFLPNSPTLMNAGTGMGLLSGCFVLPVEDSLESIFTTLKDMALIHQAGGGTGFSFSRLRPRGDVVSSTHGTASGPVSFMRIFDTTTEVIKHGGRRRGANMGVLSVSHPDIEEFVAAKSRPGAFENFNLSVAVTDAFLRAVQRGERHRLLNPRTGETVREVPARELFDLICEQAHRTGDPGLLFVDRINRDNVLPGRGRIEATNPCGEVPLLPYESCNLGSVNLPRLLGRDSLDWGRLRTVVRLLTRFLDDVIEVNRYPRREIQEATLASRKIGIGVMGLAELLARLGVPYNSDRAVRLGARIAREILETARLASAELARERGPFPLFDQSTLATRGAPPLRNAQVVSIAPTGTISLIAGTTAGIEPLFAVAYVRNVLGTHLVELNPHFDRLARERGFYSDRLAADIARTGSVHDHPEVPEDVRRAFVTALEIAPTWHLRMQAAFQRHADGAVSKTVNLPASATMEEVRAIYLAAWRAGLKGITVYRYGSRPAQVLTFLSDTPEGPAPPLRVDLEYAGGCAGRLCDV